MKLLRDTDGFTLLEVVVATAILALAMAALFPIFGSAQRTLNKAKDMSVVLELTHSRFEEELLRQDWGGLPRSGSEGEWSWQVSAKPYENMEIEGVPSYPLHVSASGWRTEDPESKLVEFDRIVWVQNQ